MEPPVAEGYWVARFVFQRGLAGIYLVAFLVAARQFRPLAGENGLLPLAERLERTSFRDRPSLLRLVPDDRAIGAAAWTGTHGSSACSRSCSRARRRSGRCSRPAPSTATPPSTSGPSGNCYRFTTPGERAETGDWWVREHAGTYVRPVARADLEVGRAGWRL